MQPMTIVRTLAVFIAAGILPGAARAAEGYVLQPEDVLSVSVYGHEEFSRDVVVLNDGRFAYPLVGRVEAAGKTADAVAQDIADGLRKELRAPQVTVSVKLPAMRRVYVSGLVGKAGSHDIKTGWRVSHLIAEAGGILGKPELARAALVRGDETIPVDLAAVLNQSDRTADLPLQPGDLLQVQPDTNLIHVVGQARSPGDYQLKNRLGVLEAVAMAGGVTDRAALTRAQVLRGGDIIKVNLHALLVEGRADGNIELKPGDTLVIPANEARIAVLGGVGQPGYFDLPDGKTVTVADALGLANGPNKNAKVNEVALLRSVDGRQVVSKLDVGKFLKNGDLSQNPAVQSGDVIYVADAKDKDIRGSNILGALTSLASPFLYAITR